MFVFARRNLVPSDLPADRDSLLLEGDWDEAAPCRESLDRRIDAPRFEYLDQAAESLAERIVAAAASRDPGVPNFADLNVLRLRYAALKWLRAIAYWRECRTGDSEVDLFVSPQRDAEHAAVWRALAAACRFSLRIHAAGAAPEAAAAFASPRNSWWRRWLGRRFADRTPQRTPSPQSTAGQTPQVVFVGNPRVLDDVCDEALRSGARVSWLYDRFAVGAWFRRRGSGVAWLTCDDNRPASNDFPPRLLREPVIYDEIDLTEVVELWYGTWREQLGAAQTRQWRRIGEHFSSQRPSRVVLDEDATPPARIVVRQAALHGVKSLVVQHGVCGVRFGYAPLTADLFCAAQEGARRQLQAWGAPSERIVVTGSPYQERFLHDLRDSLRRRDENDRSNRAARPIRVLLVAITPPRDERADSITFHLTGRTYAEMLQMACAAVAELPAAELIIKLHPRAQGCDPLLRRALDGFPQLRHRIVTKASLSDVLADVDCVLSCASSVGVDAAAAGLPVVQLLPHGSGDLNPAEWYGLVGSARRLTELRPLLRTAVSQRSRAATLSAPTNERLPTTAAAQIVDLLWDDRRFSPFSTADDKRLPAEETARGAQRLAVE